MHGTFNHFKYALILSGTFPFSRDLLFSPWLCTFEHIPSNNKTCREHVIIFFLYYLRSLTTKIFHKFGEKTKVFTITIDNIATVYVLFVFPNSGNFKLKWPFVRYTETWLWKLTLASKGTESCRLKLFFKEQKREKDRGRVRRSGKLLQCPGGVNLSLVFDLFTVSSSACHINVWHLFMKDRFFTNAGILSTILI